MAKGFFKNLFGTGGKTDGDAHEGSLAEPQDLEDQAPTPAIDDAAIDAAATPTPALAEDAPAQAEAPDADDDAAKKKPSFFQRIKQGLSKSSSKLSEGVANIFTKRKLDDAALEELEDLLITADLGVGVAARVAAGLAGSKFDKDVSPDEVRAALADEIAEALRPVAKPLDIDSSAKPHVILMAGVNGAGKTTTIGKLAQKFTEEGKSVMLAAGDTFRAAAVEQLQAWGRRAGAPVVAKPVGADAAGLAYDALQRARDENVDVLLIDTAGRLQNRKELMDELAKVVRVIKKLDADAPHDSLLVLDATVGQNALSQVEIFRDTAGLTGLIMTKLDGTARGGVLVALAEKFALPVHFIGVGEGVDDLQPFDADDFARALAGSNDLSEAAA